MDETDETTCSFCLKIVYDNAFDVVGECTRQMLIELLIPNWEINNKTVICNECATTLRDVFVFKTNFLRSENIRNIKLALKLEQNVMGLNDISEEEKICRFCKALAHSECHTNLREKEYVDMVDTIQKYISGFRFSATEKLKTCGNCLDLFQSFSNFVMNCFSMEVTIKKEIYGTDKKDHLKLNDLQNFIFRNGGKNEDNDNDIITDEIKYKYFIENDLVLHNKNEEIKIKSDQNISERFQEPSTIFKTYNGSVDISVLKSQRRHEKCIIRNKLAYKNSEEIMMHKCEICSYETKYEKHLMRHKLTHKSTVFKCELCLYEAKQLGHFNRHKLIHKSTSDLTMFKCELCSYESKRRDCLRRHKLTHKSTSEITMIKCELCSYETKRKDYLIRHTLTHKSTSDIKKFKCDLCSYEAKRKDYLTRHKLIHKRTLK